MAWFHKKLTDIEEAANVGDWKKVFQILDEHRTRPGRAIMGNKLNMAAVSIREYFESLAYIIDLLNSLDLKQKEPIPKKERERLDGFLNGAKKSVLHFEKELKKLIKEGKLKE